MNSKRIVLSRRTVVSFFLAVLVMATLTSPALAWFDEEFGIGPVQKRMNRKVMHYVGVAPDLREIPFSLRGAE